MAQDIASLIEQMAKLISALVGLFVLVGKIWGGRKPPE